MSKRQLSSRIQQAWSVLGWPEDPKEIATTLIESAIRVGFATVRGELPPPDRLIQDPMRMLDACELARLKLASPAAPEWVICYSMIELRKAGKWLLQDQGDFTKSRDWDSTAKASGWQGTPSELAERLLDFFALLCPEINDEQLGCNPTKARAFLVAFADCMDISLDPLVDWPCAMRVLGRARRKGDKRARQC